MSRYGLLLVLLLVVVSPVIGQTPTLTIAIAGAPLTLTPTADQVVALQAVVDAYNANERQGLPSWTVNQWLRQLLQERVQAAVQAHRATGARTACDAFDKLTAAAQDAIKAPLGGRSPCP